MQIEPRRLFTLRDLDLDQFNALQYGLKLLIERKSGGQSEQVKRQELWEIMMRAF